ncbi:arginine utilization regulatory protein [Desulfocicer vacuolatum DSM 3385]|uniref:Arginine utilization regulatory protein n=1 Tax=Desulfocicer vacuolatum DSM 3385 TaxID=1121400 RepID=A0A1W1YKV6_9BACT|nr:sigma 54-interacting transcriptional regulator [Desulfocicer vacuolatum]SMC36779.1 arginine utilization regulatory protein [Desulfocicer vacuolatum DSM 3385]
MKSVEIQKLFPGVDVGSIPFFSVLDQFYEGVVITDHLGHIRYFNDAQARIDDLDTTGVIGRSVRELYRVDDDDTPIIKCLESGKIVENFPCYYRTRLGRVINSIHNVFPLYAHDTLVGTICFVRDYSIVEQTYEIISQPRKGNTIQHFDPSSKTGNSKPPLANGTRFSFHDIIGTSPVFTRALTAAKLSSNSPSSIMLSGETGTGKELLAQSVHNSSGRKDKPFIAINCAAIPEHLLEGILFGTVKGAFTGAQDKAGLFEQAHGGTLFMDEVNSMSVGLQSKLLRVLQERKVRRVGSLQEMDIDLRIISSVNEDPHGAAERGALRYDLLYRLGVVLINLPPLRERMGDIEALITHFLHKCNAILGKNINAISADVMELFYNYRWIGNVRELEHVIEGAANLVEKDATVIEIVHLPVHIRRISSSVSDSSEILDAFSDEPVGDTGCAGPQSVPPGRRFKVSPGAGGQSLGSIQAENEYRAIYAMLSRFQGNISRSAKELGISPQLLHYKMKKHNLFRKDFLL